MMTEQQESPKLSESVSMPSSHLAWLQALIDVLTGDLAARLSALEQRLTAMHRDTSTAQHRSTPTAYPMIFLKRLVNAAEGYKVAIWGLAVLLWALTLAGVIAPSVPPPDFP